ncbi:MAG TPA: hypothetical protein VET90_07260 [Candidatus Binatus sp.]|nr:hypothetical protein [Candidatus Binatus sp.]
MSRRLITILAAAGLLAALPGFAATALARTTPTCGPTEIGSGREAPLGDER